MTRATWTTLALLAAGGSYLAVDAHAQDPDVPVVVPDLQLRCRVFPTPLDRDSALDTADQTTEIGQWVGSEAGYTLHTIDFEVGQKSTGFARGYVQVCLRRR